MRNGTTFKPTDLARQIGLRGLSQSEFAQAAGVDVETVARALEGKRLHTKTFGKILVALGTIPVLEKSA